MILLVGAGCSRAPRSDGTDAASGASESADFARARSLASGKAPLPERLAISEMAGSLEARAANEGAGARAVELRVTAARLLERVWRVEGREQDARDALAQYREAAHDGRDAAACEAALGAARLAGDLSHDAEAAYVELYRVQRRFPGASASCSAAVEGSLALLAPFRPPRRVLDAVDDGLAGEGVIAGSPGLAPGGATDSPTRPARITDIEAWPSPDAARVVVILDRPSAYRVGDEVFAGGAGARTFVDLDGVDLGGAVRDQPATGIVTRIRANATSSGSRVVLELDRRAWRRVFFMHDPYRIVIDVARHPPGVRGRDARQVSRVVLDPGHGGKDVGAVGPTGVREKEVTLDVAHRVAPILAGQGIQVVLTRDDDTFVSLEERTARANAFAADLFVSIHCNASESRAPRGVETYVLDTTRDEIAARVAARENATTQAATAALEVASILGGMRMADEAARSTRLAHLLQRAAIAALRMRYGDTVDGGVHTAGFYVLVGARMPSVLFEASYLSNAGDEQRLGSEDGRQIFADAVANAIRAYREGR
jgi:N-acetylmuramoyl-L-alanine amidase